jgi:hypothetical protein
MTERLTQDVQRMSEQLASAVTQRIQQEQGPVVALQQKLQDRQTLRRILSVELFKIGRQTFAHTADKDDANGSANLAKACVDDANALMVELEQSEEIDREEIGRRMAAHIKPATAPRIIQKPSSENGN